MSRSARALALLSVSGATLAEARGGEFGVFAHGNRRRRPRLRLSKEEVRQLEADGAIAAHDGVFQITPAGRSRVLRDGGAEGFQVQHGGGEMRTLIDSEGDARIVRAALSSTMLARLAQLRDGRGRPWLADAELRAAAHLRADWERGQAGLQRGSDWTAPPNASSARGKSSGYEGFLAHRIDARRRTADALAALAAPLRRAVEAVCLREVGVEALERAEGWPGRSGKLALKLGLAQLAALL
jgi:hypothetical protein